jgi:hypothetical protein
MKRHATAWTVVGLLAALGASRARAADDATVRRDLTSTIALQGLPCGQVVAVVRQGDNDYVASCQDGNRYHVFVNAQGRVVVQKQ